MPTLQPIQPAPFVPESVREAARRGHDIAATGEPTIYQPFLRDEERQRICPAAVPLDIAFNTAANSREYELFKTMHAEHAVSGFPREAFWGVLSTKFEQKARVPLAEFRRQAAQAAAAGCDAFIFNPMIGNAAITLHTWEQGVISGHTGMDRIAAFLQQQGYPVGNPQGLSSYALCNYMCGNSRFWTSYFHFCDGVLDLLEAEARAGTAVGCIYGGTAAYVRDSSATFRPFVAERLPGTFIQVAELAGNLRIRAYEPTEELFALKFGHKLGSRLQALLAQKNQAIATVDPPAFAAWTEERLPYAREPHLIWMLDDPPLWLPPNALEE